MKIMIAILMTFFGLNAFAANDSRQRISCKENTKSKSKHLVVANFNPDVALSDMWRTDEKNRDYIETYKNGDLDGKEKTTARVSIFMPGKKNSEWAGKFQLSEYYVVNQRKKAHDGYSDSKFGGKAYRVIHGHDKNQMFDVMFYYPEEAVDVTTKGFKALLTYQPSITEQGYYHIDLVCNSTIK